MIKNTELAGLVLGWMVLVYVVEDLTFKKIVSFCDNTPEVEWTYKGRTSTSIPKDRLLLLLALQKQ